MQPTHGSRSVTQLSTLAGFDRLSGVLLVLGGILGIVAHLLHPGEPNSPEQISSYIHHTAVPHLVLFFASLCVMFGLPAICLRIRRAGVKLALIGLPMLFFGVALSDMMHSPVEFGPLVSGYAAAPQQIAQIYVGMRSTPFGILTMLASPLVLLGLIVFCATTYRVRGAYLLGWIALVVSAVCMVLTQFGVPYANMVFPILFYVGWAIDGFALLRKEEYAADRNAPELEEVGSI